VPGVDRPWYISLILGTAGWFAGIFLLIFVGMLFKPDSAPGALITAAVLLGSAYALFRVDREGAFVTQLALALSIAGQFALLFGIYSAFFTHGDSITGIAMVGLVIQVALAAIMPNDLHKTMCTLFAVIAWGLLLRFGLVSWLVTWIPVAMLLYGAIVKGWLPRPMINGLIVGLAYATLISYPLDALESKHVLSVWPLLSAIASLGAIVAAFAHRSRGLMALCIIATVLHVSHFYYQMDTSLLIKSMIMMVLGVAFLAGARRWR
jgi:hypothetical protein